MNRYVVLYLVTLFVLVPLDFLFLGVVAKDFFTSQVGNMLGEIKLVPAVLFYLLYVVGVVIFVNGGAAATWQSTLLYGALFGLFCYATFDLTSLSLLRHWSWPVAIVDIRPSRCQLAAAENLRARHSGFASRPGMTDQASSLLLVAMTATQTIANAHAACKTGLLPGLRLPR